MNKKTLTIHIIIYSLAVAINMLIIVYSCFNGYRSSMQSSRVATVVENVVNTFNPTAVTNSNRDQFKGVIRKLVGHFGFFFVSGIFSTLSIYFLINKKKWYKFYYLIPIGLGFGLFWASLSEIIQLLIPGRSGQFSDVMIDFLGYMITFLIVFLIIYLYEKKKKEKKICLLNEK